MHSKIKSNSFRNSISKIFKRFLSKLMITIIIFLLGMIIVKENPKFKTIIRKNVYEASFKFNKTKKAYEKYFGNILSIDKISPTTKEVFAEKLHYSDSSTYKDGVKLKVSKNYMVPTLESGVVVFIGDKKDYGKTIVIEQTNGISTWYGNINTNNIKLYDYIEKGTLLGESINSKLYLVFQKEGKFLDYKKYI